MILQGSSSNLRSLNYILIAPKMISMKSYRNAKACILKSMKLKTLCSMVQITSFKKAKEPPKISCRKLKLQRNLMSANKSTMIIIFKSKSCFKQLHIKGESSKRDIKKKIFLQKLSIKISLYHHNKERQH